MRTIIFSLALIIILAGCSSEKDRSGENASAAFQEIDTTKYRKAAKGFMQELKGVLVTQLQNNGVESAIKVCSDTAQVLTKNYGDKNNINISRVSLKTRNKANQPDAYEQKALKQFENLNSKNKLTKNTELVEAVNFKGEKQIRYMKPILTNGVCLNCHGSNEQVSPKAKKVIAANYENDEARNYKVGDVRGAISIVDELN